jgi:large subunit ribosomal protein L23
MANVFGVIKRPLVTEKGMTAKESSQTLCFEVDARSNKNEIRHAVEKAFKVKVDEVRTSTTAGKLRRRGKFSGYRADWKKAWVRLKTGQKMPEYSEI